MVKFCVGGLFGAGNYERGLAVKFRYSLTQNTVPNPLVIVELLDITYLFCAYVRLGRDAYLCSRG